MLDSETVRCIPRPAFITNKELMYLNTIYTVKADGRQKARTVLSWREADSDQHLYPDTYSPTARPTTFRMLCALAAQLGWTIRPGPRTSRKCTGT